MESPHSKEGFTGFLGFSGEERLSSGDVQRDPAGERDARAQSLTTWSPRAAGDHPRIPRTRIAMAMAPEPFFFTPPPAPRHLAELRIDPAHYAVAFSAPCAAVAGRTAASSWSPPCARGCCSSCPPSTPRRAHRGEHSHRFLNFCTSEPANQDTELLLRDITHITWGRLHLSDAEKGTNATSLLDEYEVQNKLEFLFAISGGSPADNSTYSG